MPRYIDADLMIADIQRYLCANCSIHCNPISIKNSACEIAECLRMIYNAPTVDDEPVKGWISVKERLPENDGKYMVWYKGVLDICEFDAESQTFGYTYDDYDEMYSHLVCWDDNMDKYVTHWMPLPEPPKGECSWVDDDSLPNEDMRPDNEFIGGW